MSGQWWESNPIVGPFSNITDANAWAAANPSSLFLGLLATINGVPYSWGGAGVGWIAAGVDIDTALIRNNITLYDVQNGLWPRETAIHISPEGLVPLSAGDSDNLAKLRINGLARGLVKRHGNITANKVSESVSIPITDEAGLLVANTAITLTTCKLSAVPSTAFRPVIIGDSIAATDLPAFDKLYTASFGLASAMCEFWIRDSVDGLSGSCTLLGTLGNQSATTLYRGSARTLRAFNEGRPGWAAATYLRHPVLLTASAVASTAAQANGAASWAFLGKVASVGAWTGSQSQKDAIRTTYFSNTTAWDYNADLWDYLKLRPGWGGTGSWVDNGTNRGHIDTMMAKIKLTPDNVFWSKENAASAFFNPYVWTDAYKTLSTGLARLVVGSTAGSKITAENLANIDVIDKPTHFFIELGENDRWQFGAVSVESVIADIELICAGISTAYAWAGANAPKIALVFTRGPGKFNPTSESNVESQEITRFSTGGLIWKQQLSDGMKARGRVVIDADVVQDPASASNFSADMYEYSDRGQQIPGIAYDKVHPGISGLRGVAYQCYAWMLSTVVA